MQVIIIAASILFLSTAIIIVVCEFLRLLKNKKFNKNVISFAGVMVALATALYSINASDQSLKSAERLALIQNKPYITVEGMRFSLKKEEISRDANEDVCEYQILLKNNGALPAINVCLKLKLSFKNAIGGAVVLSNDPSDKGAIIFSSNTNRFVIGTGGTTRVQVGKLFINKEDSGPFVNGERTLGVVIKIDYSAAEYNKRWSYKLEGIWNGHSLDIYNEDLS